MFGLKIFTKAKSKSFANDKERKRYYAIQSYYQKKQKTQKSKEAHTKKEYDR